MQSLLVPATCLAIAGFSASLLVHALALAGHPSPFGSATWLLHVGVFAVWLPAVLVAQRRGVKQAELWKATFQGCPVWVRNGSYGVFAYALVNFVLFVSQAVSYPKNKVPDLLEFRGFSGHWMLFYYVAAALLYSATRQGTFGERLCPHGHEASPFAKHCDSCGAALPPAP